MGLGISRLDVAESAHVEELRKMVVGACRRVYSEVRPGPGVRTCTRVSPINEALYGALTPEVLDSFSIQSAFRV
jgi:hypothetical protein